MPKIKLPKNAAQMKAEMAVKRAKTPSVEVKKPQESMTQYELAHKLAQERAALPVEQGGLGLPPDNTAMDRAKALGYEEGWAHGSPDPTITELRSSRIGAQGPGAYATNYLPETGMYSKSEPGATSYPLMVRRKEAIETGFNNPYDELKVKADDELLSELFSRNKSAIVTTQEKTPEWLLNAGVPDMPERSHFVSVKPSNFRSRFAAFDPFEINSPDLLKAKGGAVQKMAVGGTPFSGGSLYQDEEREREFRETPSYDAMSMSGHIPAFSVYNKPTYASSIPGAIPSANQQRREYTEEGMVEQENRERVKDRDYLSTIDPAGTLGVTDVLSTLGKGILSVPAQIAGNVVDYFRTGKVTPESEKRREEAIGEWAAPKTQEGAEFLGEMMSIPEKVTGSSMGLGSHPFLWVHGIGTPSPAQMKAGLRLAREKAAPTMGKIDTAIRQGYESGMIPQPGMSIKDVGTFTSGQSTPTVDNLGFYSPAEAAAMKIQRKSGVGQAFISDLKKAGVTDDEINSIGLNDWLADKKNVSADEVRNYIAENRIQLKENRYSGRDVKYEDYAMPGGENYREVTLSLPKGDIDAAATRQTEIERILDSGKLTAEEKKPLYEEHSQLADKIRASGVYESSHWNEPNVIAHLRMKDFNDADGKKVLMVEEVQSDWHQAGRDRGYAKKPDTSKWTVKNLETDNPNDVGVYDQNGNEVWVGSATGNDRRIIDRAVREIYSDAVPDAPFKDTWYQLALKRAIKEAADNGYDRVALPTGKSVAERFDLTKHIDTLSYQKNKSGNYNLMILPKDGDEFVNMGYFPADQLSDMVGKDMAKKIIEGKGNKVGSTGIYTFPRINITVGGEGMKKYYDEVYPSYLNKFAKKHGATVGETTIDAGGTPEKVRYMDITPSMRESVKKGVPYKKGGAVDKPSKMRHNSQNLTAKQPSLDVMRLALQKRG